ncbi:MAG: serine/threonine-protein kinase, partial [Cyanobacteriota bacterium]
MIGNLLDQRYQVVEVLGQGGFGHTYTAKDTRRPGNPTCVVKLLRPAISDPDFLQTARRLFNSEAETLEKLGNHDQIPRLLAYFEEKEEFYLVQEFIDGHPLSAELSPGQRWSESQVIQFLQEVLSILEFVHGNGVIHRDLKPDNLIRRSVDNKLVLVDFGAVKQVKMQSLVALEPMKALEPIEQTVAIGTPGYMPSEQGQGRPRPSSDIYALGMIGIQALTGLNPMHLAEDIETGEIIWRHQAQVNDGLAFILDKMVRHYFKHRYPSATEALQALEALTNPNTPKDWAMALSQKGRSYFNNGYQSANHAVRSLQGLAKSYISTNHQNSLPDRTVTISPGKPSSSPVGWQSLLASVTKFHPKAPLLIGAGTATVAIALTISAIRKPPSPSAIAQNQSGTAQNQTDIKQNQPEIIAETPKPAEPTPVLAQLDESKPNKPQSE